MLRLERPLLWVIASCLNSRHELSGEQLTATCHLHNYAPQPFSRKEVSRPLLTTFSVSHQHHQHGSPACVHATQSHQVLPPLTSSWDRGSIFTPLPQTRKPEGGGGNLSRSFREKEEESEFPPRSAPTPETKFSLFILQTRVLTPKAGNF